MEINKQQLLTLFPKLKGQYNNKTLIYDLDEGINYFNAAINEFELNKKLRLAAFLGQTGIESDQLTTFVERGSKEYFDKYDHRYGNMNVGDGFKYRGRSPLQLTFLTNYEEIGKIVDLDLVNNPDLAAKLENTFRVACAYWVHRGLNDLADKLAFTTITHRINGGFNQLAERMSFYQQALKIIEG